MVTPIQRKITVSLFQNQQMKWYIGQMAFDNPIYRSKLNNGKPLRNPNPLANSLARSRGVLVTDRERERLR